MTDYSDTYTVDLTETIDFLRMAREIAATVQDTEVMMPHVKGAANVQARANVTKQLLFIKHLCDRAGLAAMDSYFAAKGETLHLLEDAQ